MESLAVSQLLGELLDACQVGDDDVVKNILEGGMVDINGVDEGGRFPLMLAVDENHPNSPHQAVFLLHYSLSGSLSPPTCLTP